MVRSKSLRLFKKASLDIGYEDLQVNHFMVTGFPVVGQLDEVPAFERKPPGEEVIGADPE